MLYFPKDFLNNIVSPDSYDEDKIIDVFLRHSNCTAKNRLQTVQTTSERLTFFCILQLAHTILNKFIDVF